MMAVSPEDRKLFEELGEARVRLTIASGRFEPPFGDSEREWLAEIDQATRKRNEALQAEQTRLNKSTLRAAWIAAGAAIVGIIVTIGLSYAQYRMANAEVVHNRMVKDGIGLYISEGRAIMNRFGLNEMPMPTMDEVGWIGRTEDFLRTNLCESYVTRFNDFSGLGRVTGTGTDAAHNVHYNDFHMKLMRLEEFSREPPSC